MQTIEAKIGTQVIGSWTSDAVDDHDMVDTVDGDADDYEEISSPSSEVLIEDRPSHMNSLFQNEWISTDSQRNTQLQHDRQLRTKTQILDEARSALQPLIPELEDVAALSNHFFSWLSILQELCPTTSLANSPEGILASYEDMKKPDVDPFRLACWLLALAITSMQLQQDVQSPASLIRSFQKRFNFAQAIQRTVDNHIMSHDSILGTVSGLETALMFLRLNLTRGALQKSWLGLRRVVAIAELIGLPRVSKLLQQRTAEGLPATDPNMVIKATLWESICALERVAGTLMTFPVATRIYSVAAQKPLVVNGAVQLATYWLKLSDIAIQVQDLDDLHACSTPDAEILAKVLALDSELRSLAWATPREWWAPVDKTTVDAGCLLRFQHYSITMRVHLPFTIRSDPRNQYVYSRMAGIEACEAVARAWCDLRQSMPIVIFFARPFDAQAFTAAVVLLLTHHGSKSRNNRTGDETDTSKQDLLERVSRIMEEKSKEPIGADFANQATIAMRSLKALLEGKSDPKTDSEGLLLKVPLLGTINIKRKVPAPEPSMPSQGYSQRTQQENMELLRPWPEGGQSTVSAGYSSTVPLVQTNTAPADNNQDTFSWFINADDEALFHENLMMEEFGFFNPWYPS